MKKNLNILGVVGARSGSKGIPNKNIKPLLGKPLMWWVIEAAKKSKLVNRLILSTDSKQYAELGKKFEVEVPFIRPKKYAADSVDDISYLSHAVAWLEKHDNWKADIVVRIIPTTPLLKPQSIDSCVRLLINDQTATSVRTIVPAPKNPYKLWRINNGVLKPFLNNKIKGVSDPSNTARQLLPPAFAHVDVIALSYDTLMNKKLMSGRKALYLMLKKDEAIDIDNLNDFLLAEILLKKRVRSGK